MNDSLFPRLLGALDGGLRHARETLGLLRGLDAFHGIEPIVTVFGSARFTQDHPYCVKAEELGFELARAGYAVMTGAGPGVMEAVSRGAKSAGGRTLGVNIVVPHEQRSNPYIDVAVTFETFWARKTSLIRHSSAFVAMPGGFGTLDEVTEVLNLIQARKMDPAPLILVDSGFWRGFIEFCRDPLLSSGAIDDGLLARLEVVDTPSEAVDRLRQVLRRPDQDHPDHEAQGDAVDGEAEVAEAPQDAE